VTSLEKEGMADAEFEEMAAQAELRKRSQTQRAFYQGEEPKKRSSLISPKHVEMLDTIPQEEEESPEKQSELPQEQQSSKLLSPTESEVQALP